MKNSKFNSLKIVIASTSFVIANFAFADEEYTDLFKVRIQATQAEVVATSTSSGNKVTIKVDKTRMNSSCKYEVSQASKELVINAVQSNTGLNCPLEFTISLPATVHFDAILASGSVRMNGDFSDSIFDVESGRIELNGQGGTVQFKGKKTSIDFRGTADHLEAAIDEGAINIDYTSLPRSGGEMQIDSKKGDVTIGIPRGVELSGSYSVGKGQAIYKTRSGYSLRNKLDDGNLKIKRN